MKLISILVLLNLFLSSFAYSSTKYQTPNYSKEMKREYVKKKMKKYKGFKKNVLKKIENKYDKLICLKKGEVVTHLISPEQSTRISRSFVEKKKSFLKKLFKAFFGKIQITEILSSNESLLKIKLSSKKNKYTVKKIYYKLGSVFSPTNSIDTVEEGTDIVATIDISNLPVGEFKTYFKFLYEKNKKKKKKLYSTYGYGVFEKKEKLVNIIANIEIEHDQDFAFVRVDTSASTSDAGDIVKFTYITYKDNIEFDRVTSDFFAQTLVFQEQGQFEIQVEIEDSAGNIAISERRNVQITNASPNTQYTITQIEEFNGHYQIDASASTDFEDGKNLRYRYVLYSTNLQGGFQIYVDHYTENDKYSIAVPEASREYTVVVFAFDSTDQSGSGGQKLIQFEGDSIAPKLIGHYISTEQLFVNVKYIGAAFTSTKPIVEYIYTVTHEDGEVVPLFEPFSTQDNAVELTKPGLWTYEFYGVDEDGNKSDTLTVTENNTWRKEDFIPVGIYNDIDVSGHDPRIQYIYTGFEDKFGEIVKYEYIKAEHEDGTLIQPFEVNFSKEAKEFRFTKKGNYNFTVVATDNYGNQSVPYSFSYSIDWGDFDPNGDFIPPMPDETLNNSTLLGIDSDSDGVRDDVEIWINNRFPDNTEMRKAFKQMARASQQIFTVFNDKQLSIDASYSWDEALNCTSALLPRDPEGYGIAWDLMSRAQSEQRILLFNTKKRILANIKYNNQLGGSGRSPRVMQLVRDGRSKLELCK